MKSHTPKISTANRMAAEHTVHKKHDTDTAPTQFIDNRPEATSQLRLREYMQNSPRTLQLKTIQESTHKRTAQRIQAEEEVKPAQEKFAATQKNPEFSETERNNNTGLPNALKAGVEKLSGMDLSDVKVHYNSHKPSQLHAHAYAQGTDIHLAPGQEKHLPHETWHVAQQKQGRVKPTAQLKDVNINDDASLEEEADVKGKAALQLVLGAQSVMQLASDYDGILPAHDTYRDSYAFDSVRSSEFTYHHIIPENKLKLVGVELKGIKEFFDELEETDQNQQLRQKGVELEGKVGDLITGAKTGWLNTRIKNVSHIINDKYDTYGIEVKESDVRDIMTQHNETIGALFPAFRDFLKPKTKPAYDTQRSAINRFISQALKDNTFYTHVNSLDENGIRGKLSDGVDTKIYDLNTMVTDTMNAIRGLRASQKHGQLNKGKVRDAVVSAINSWSFDDYYTNLCTPLHEDATTSDNHLKKIVQKNALPNDEDSHLEHAVQWNPGNIHRGPSSSKRLNPESGNDFDEILDDGGERFEKAAVNLVASNHFEALVNLNRDIDTFLQTKVANTPPDNNKVDLAKSIVDQMKTIQTKGLTQFKESQWEMKGNDKMRLIKNNQLVEEANTRNLL